MKQRLEPLTESDANASFRALAKAFAGLERVDEMAAFLRDLCTPAELEATSAASGCPTQTAWVTIRLCCSSSCSERPDGSAPGSSSRRGCAPSSLSALLPKPVAPP